MDIAALNTPATPPYECQHHSPQPVEPVSTQNVKLYVRDPYFDRPFHSADHAEAELTPLLNNETETNQNSFRRVSPMSMPSPPELLNDACEDGDLNTSLSTVSSFSLSDDDTIHKKRKSTPHRSPTNIVTDYENVVFRLERNFSSTILSGPTTADTNNDHGLLWTLRQRVITANQSSRGSMVSQKRNSLSNARKLRLFPSKTEKRVLKPMKIRIPRPQWLKDIMIEEAEEAEEEEVADEDQEREEEAATEDQQQHFQTAQIDSLRHNQTNHKDSAHTNPLLMPPNFRNTNAIYSWQADVGTNNLRTNEVNHLYHSQPRSRHFSTTTSTPMTVSTPSSSASVPRRKSSNHGSSGRPTRIKGPCQACHETSDGCMRKAFHWPFPTNTTYNDKGKPFVYLCNKCGLRYNKSGGCVCRHCRWVLCKEEKRKAMELIDLMRRSRPDGRIDPEENIENFVCTPKYWNCGHPWKVSWVLNALHDDEDDEDDIHDRGHNSTIHVLNPSTAAPVLAPALYVGNN